MGKGQHLEKEEAPSMEAEIQEETVEEELDETTQIADMNVEGMPWYRKAKPLYPDSGLPKTEMSKKETFRFAVSATVAGLLVGLIMIGACAIFILFCIYVWFR